MRGITLLIIIIFIGYFFNRRYPQPLKFKIYFGIGCTVFLVFIYFMNYQKNFVYKVARNIKDIQTQPLHSAIPNFHNPTIKGNNFKYQLADKQGLRCHSCKNPIMLEDINSYKVSYITPLNMGGLNDPSNLKLICPSCFQFRNSIHH